MILSLNYRPANNTDTLSNSDKSTTQEAIQQTTSYLNANTNDISEHMTMDIPSHCLLSLVGDPQISTLNTESVFDSAGGASDLLVIPYISRCLLKHIYILKRVSSYILFLAVGLLCR